MSNNSTVYRHETSGQQRTGIELDPTGSGYVPTHWKSVQLAVTEARKLARRSTDHGHYEKGSTLSVNCPMCRSLISISYSLHATDSKGKRLSKIDQLRREVFEHVQWNCDGNTRLFDGFYR